MTTTTTITHEPTRISASPAAWRALGFIVYDNGKLDNGPHGIESLLYYGIQVTESHDERAVIATIVERDRRNEERTRVTAEARLAESIGKLAASIGAESAESLVRRLPERLRPYAEQVLRNR